MAVMMVVDQSPLSNHGSDVPETVDVSMHSEGCEPCILRDKL